jgi:hypothetical protein
MVEKPSALILIEYSMILYAPPSFRRRGFRLVESILSIVSLFILKTGLWPSLGMGRKFLPLFSELWTIALRLLYSWSWR